VSRVSFFEFASPDPAKEMEFFKTLFGWEFQKFGDQGQDYWLVTTGPKEEPGIDGGLLPLMSDQQPRTTNTITVPDIDEAVAKAAAAGATMMMDKQEIPNFGWTAYMISPTGIPFGLFQGMPGGSM
jgi:predicted enzyme related to lactoylglutathione lyase